MLQRCGYTVRLWVYGEKADSFRKNLYGLFGRVCTPVVIVQGVRFTDQ